MVDDDTGKACDISMSMNSRRVGGKASSGGGGNSSQKGKNIEEPGYGRGNPKVDQLSHDVADVSRDPSQEGEWEVIGKKSRNRAAAAAAKPMASSNYALKACIQPEGVPRQGGGANGGVRKTAASNRTQASEANDYRKPVGRGSQKPQSTNRGLESVYMAPPPAIAPPLQNGWQWATRGGSQSKAEEEISSNILPQGGSAVGYDSESQKVSPQPDDGSDDDELIEDTDDDFSDDYDSDVSQKSHETRKENKWFKAFFESLDRLAVDEINEPTRQWHCPACHNGPGGIEWYKGLQPLMTHAKTKGATRVKLHRELAVLLDEELRRRGTSVIPAGEAFGKWKGLRETTTDHDIVWPPMVVVMNTLLEQDDNDKWSGMGNQELLEYFHGYAATKARHSYGPRGHRGMSVLIFEPTAMGYLEAERLHKHFAEQGTDRDAWQHRRVLFLPGGKRQLYGYLASKEDMDIFNQHCQGKSRLKFEMKSYQDMVVIPMKQMSEDNQQLIWYKNKVVKQERHSKALEESYMVTSQKLREAREENKIVRLRSKIQHEENKEEMDYQERFFKEQMAKVHKEIEEKERSFEKLLQEERAKAKQSDVDSGTNEDRRLRKEEIARFIESQVKDVEEFEAEREKLIDVHEEKKVELRKKHLVEEVELEKEFDAALTKLMEKYAPNTFQASSST